MLSATAASAEGSCSSATSERLTRSPGGAGTEENARWTVSFASAYRSRAFRRPSAGEVGWIFMRVGSDRSALT